MPQRSCDLCQNTAVIHDTGVRAGVVKVRHLCRTHGLQIWREAMSADGVSPGALKKNPVFQSLVADTAKTLKRRGDSGPTHP